MKRNFYKELVEMTAEAILELERYELTGDSNLVFNKIRAVSSPCLDGQKINQEIKSDIPMKKQHLFESAIFSLARLSSLSAGRGQNPHIKSHLEFIQEVATQLSKTEQITRPLRLFYSWQSDLPNRTNRSLIKNCIEKAIKELNKDIPIEDRMQLDSDTTNIPGSPDIIHTILQKIDSSSIFIADVSLITNLQPNSNVMFELGYAVKALSDKRIIMIFNENFGKTQDLPFDLGFKRQIIYQCSEDISDNKESKIELTAKIKVAISLILENQDNP